MEKLTFICDVAGRRVTVPAIVRGLYGVYYDGKPYSPCVETLIDLAPYHWRKAIERSIGFWSSNASDVMRLDLNRARDGAAMGSIFARASWRENDCFLDGYARGLLRATYIKVDSGYSVAAICGTLKITVPPALAESKIDAARAQNAAPVFYYD